MSALRSVSEHLEELLVAPLADDPDLRCVAAVVAERLRRLAAEDDPAPEAAAAEQAAGLLARFEAAFRAAGGIPRERIDAAVEDCLGELGVAATGGAPAAREDVESVAADLAETLWTAGASFRAGGMTEDDLARLAVRAGEGVAEVAGRLPALWSWASRWIAVYGLDERHPALDAWLEELAVRHPARAAFERAVRRPSAERVRVLAERAAERLARNLEAERRVAARVGWSASWGERLAAEWRRRLDSVGELLQAAAAAVTRPLPLPVHAPLAARGAVEDVPGDRTVWRAEQGAWWAYVDWPSPATASDEVEVRVRVHAAPADVRALLLADGLVAPVDAATADGLTACFRPGDLRAHNHAGSGLALLVGDPFCLEWGAPEV